MDGTYLIELVLQAAVVLRDHFRKIVSQLVSENRTAICHRCSEAVLFNEKIIEQLVNIKLEIS